MTSALSLAESFLQSGNAAAAFKLLSDFPEPSLQRDLLLGKCALKLNNVAGAVAALTAALTRDPRHCEAARLLGDLYVRLGWIDKAEAFYSKFLKKTEDDQVRVQYGCLQVARERNAAALSEFGRVLARSPRHAGARQHRGDVLATVGRYAEAAEDYRQLTRESPKSVAVWGNLGVVESHLGNYDAAVECLTEALRQKPGNGRFLFDLAAALTLSGRVEEARAAFAHLRQVDPARWQELQAATKVDRGWGVDDEIDPRPFFLLYTYRELNECNWTYRQAYEDIFANFIKAPRGSPVAFVHCAGIAPLTMPERRQLLEHAATTTAACCQPEVHALTPMPARLRIGYALPHLGEHVVANILERLLAAHTAAVEVFVISLGMTEQDYASPQLARVKALPGVQWVDVTSLDNAAAAACVHALGLDVLVDLAVYNDHARPAIFARRPAPVQVNWLGAPYTSGAPWMDYVITDAVASPGEPGWCTEAEVRMPQCYFVFGPAGEDPPAVPTRTALDLPEKKFIYSALHNGYKIDPESFAVWMRILKATPESVLLLKDGKKMRANLCAQAERHGVAPERLVFAAKLPAGLYLARQGAPDLFLDARLYNGHTTMAESLWMGTPALTCPGDAFQNRIGASLLISCGLGELVMSDWATYEATAIAFYHDRPRLMALRETLAARRFTAAPFDMPGQARALERAYRQMRERFARGLLPAPFAIADLVD